MRVFVFPGQGSQKVGMGEDFYQNFSVAKNVFHEVDDTLGFKLSELMFKGDLTELSMTKNTQPALMTIGIAILKVLEQELGKKVSEISSYLCGHSLGEFTALCASGVIELKDTAKLLKIRGEAMQEAVPMGQGAMAALISGDFSKISELLLKVSEKGICEIANENSKEQIVISGNADAVKEAVKISSSFNIKKSILLNVSAPFHCKLMLPAQEKLREKLNNIKFNDPQVSIICNYTGLPENNPIILKNNIIEQVVNKVKWRETMNFLSNEKLQQLVELGSGKVLTNIAKRMSNQIHSFNIETLEDFKEKLSNFS